MQVVVAYTTVEQAQQAQQAVLSVISAGAFMTSLTSALPASGGSGGSSWLHSITCVGGLGAASLKPERDGPRPVLCAAKQQVTSASISQADVTVVP